MPGYRPIHAYPLQTADVKKANEILRRAGKRCGAVTLYARNFYRGLAQVLKRDWGRIGCRVHVKYLSGDLLEKRAGRRKEPFDAAIAGWIADYLDPATFMNLFDGSKITAANNVNWAYLNDTQLNKKIRVADGLTGSARISAFQRLDALITKRYVPWVAIHNQLTGYFFFSSRVGGVVTQLCSSAPVVDLAALRLKH